MAASKGDVRVHGNQYGHTIIISGGLLEEICWCLNIPLRDCNEPEHHARISKFVLDAATAKANRVLGEEA